MKHPDKNWVDTCERCDAVWSGDRACHCVRCHHTFFDQPSFYAHFKTVEKVDVETEAQVFEITGCIHPAHILGDDGASQFVPRLNDYGTMAWIPTSSRAGQKRLNRSEEN